MDIEEVRKEPINAIRYPKKGTAIAMFTVLATNIFWMHILQITWNLDGDEGVDIISSNSTAIGLIIKLYFAKGVIVVVYIANFEAIALQGRFNVTCDDTPMPDIV